MKRKKMINVGDINQILLSAFIVRVIALMIIVTFGDNLPSMGFIDNSELYDDYRYEQGAFLYSRQAKSLIDVETFTSVYDSLDDWTGHNLAKPFESTPLWYWLCCIMVYLSKTRWSIRIFNISFFVFSIKVIWKIAKEIYGEETAFLSARLMAYLPYFVIFSCFSYKDILVLFCTFSLFWQAIAIKKGFFSSKDVIKVLLCVLSMLLMRSGLIIVLLGLLIIYIYIEKIERKVNKRKILLFPILAVCGVYGLYRFGDTIMYKFSAYNSGEAFSELGLGRFVKISSIAHVWKLPLTYFFSVLQPIGLFCKLNSWYGIVSNLNFLMTPIAVGSGLYILKRKKEDKSFFWISLSYYLITAVSSILIFRQLFSLLPIPVLYFSSIYKTSTIKTKRAIWGGTLFMILILFMAFGIKNGGI